MKTFVKLVYPGQAYQNNYQVTLSRLSASLIWKGKFLKLKLSEQEASIIHCSIIIYSIFVRNTLYHLALTGSLTSYLLNYVNINIADQHSYLRWHKMSIIIYRAANNFEILKIKFNLHRMLI